MKRIFTELKWPGMLLITGCLSMTSCKKEAANDTAPSDTEVNQAMDAAVSNQTASEQFNDVFDITMGIGTADAGEDIGIGTGEGILYRPGSGNGTTGGGHCFTVTVVPGILHHFPKTITVDFGDGCKGIDGKVRKGSIIAIFTGPMKKPGSKVSVTFKGYSVDSFAIQGTQTIQNTSSSNKLSWTTGVLKGKITNTESGKWKEWEGKRVHTKIEGNGTPLYLGDDVYKISGNASGSNSKGNSWTSEIREPIIRKFTCKWRVKGIVEIHRNANPHAITLDYGDGSCDNKATVTYRGITKEITLK